VDAFLDPRGQASDLGRGKGTAIFYVCPCDVERGSWQKALQTAQQHAKERSSGHQGAALLQLLNGAMRHHVRLVRRAGYAVELRLAPHADALDVPP
jgi:hypothetical protein